MKLTVAVIGCGEFAKNFVPLFKAHPTVEKVYVCDLIPEKAQAYAQQFQVDRLDSFAECLKRPDINTVAIFAQRHFHGPLVIQALKAGKHVYSAVPMASEVEQCQEIVELVQKTGLTYMMGETCVYYPCSMYCRQEMQKGTFGNFVYAEAQYHHDISDFPAQFLADRKTAGLPPFFYPTHSTAMVLNAAGTFAKKVVAFGYEDQEKDGIFEKGINIWDNTFSNSFSLMKLANGGTARINECRRIGYKAPSSYISAFYGTKGSYQFSNAQHILVRKTGVNKVQLADVSGEVNPAIMTQNQDDPDFKNRVANHEWQWNNYSPQHDQDVARLPASFRDLPNGHMGSHQILIDDFCTAACFGKLPTVNAWLAARFTVPGLLAHQSALKDGLTIDVPDYGEPPTNWVKP